MVRKRAKKVMPSRPTPKPNPTVMRLLLALGPREMAAPQTAVLAELLNP